MDTEVLKKDIAKMRRTAVVQDKFHQHAIDIMEAYDRLVEVLELQIQQLKDKAKDDQDIINTLMIRL